MSNLRSAYPQAQAWTFLIDTPPPANDKKKPATAVARGAAAAAATAAPTGASIRPVLATGVRTRPNKGSSGNGDGGGGRSEANGTEEMGAMCSKPGDSNTVANKENMGEATTVDETPPNGINQITMAGGNSSGGEADSSNSTRSKGDAGAEASETPGGESADRLTEDEAAPMLQGTALDSTAFLSPDPEEERGTAGDNELGSLSAVDDGAAGVVAGLVKGGHAGSNGNGGMEFEDRSAWVARNLGMLPRGGQEVEVDKLREVRDGGRRHVYVVGCSSPCMLVLQDF